MDRNDEQTEQDSAVEEVALRKESVDRNETGKIRYIFDGVALRKESVDRNFKN